MPSLGDFTVDRNNTKYVLGSSGTLVAVPADEPAFEFNPDGSYKGLLVEPASTNICLQSEDINTTWSPLDYGAVATDATETPDGDTSSKYIKIVDDGSTGTGSVLIYQSIDVSAGTKYTASVFLKADGLSFALVQALFYDGATNGSQFFGLSGAGSLGTASNLDDSSIEAYPNGWYRCSITWTQGASDTNFQFRIYVADSISNTLVDLDGTSSIFAWGAQVEASPIATSYIPTTTGNVQRVKDDINLSPAASLIGQNEGTLYVEVDWRDTTPEYQWIVELSDGTVNNRVSFYNYSGNLTTRVTADGTTTSISQSSTGYSGIQKIAYAYANGDQEAYRNGSSIGTTTGSLTALATLTDIDLGQVNFGIVQANMWIRAVALYRKRLSDSECEALTTL